MERKKLLTIVGVAMIIIALVFGGFYLYKAKQEKKEESPKNDVSVSQQEEEIEVEMPPGNDTEPLDKEKAEQVMDLTITMPDEMKERIPKYEVLERGLIDYLVEQGFWGGVSEAEANVITEDFKQNLMIISFELDDEVNTTVDCIYNKDKDECEFNFY